jgi:hypothetical protein
VRSRHREFVVALGSMIRPVTGVRTGLGEADPCPTRGEELVDPAPLHTGQGNRASLCYTVTEVRDLTA